MKHEMCMAWLYALPGIPLVRPCDALARIISESPTNATFQFEDRDIVVIAQKFVSKVENAVVDLAIITPTPAALMKSVVLLHCLCVNQMKRVLAPAREFLPFKTTGVK